MGRLYFHAYEPGIGGETAEEATADIAASWDGEYGVSGRTGHSLPRSTARSSAPYSP